MLYNSIHKGLKHLKNKKHIQSYLLAVGLSASKTVVEYTYYPAFKAFSIAQTTLKDMINDILALDVYFFFKLDEFEHRNCFPTDCMEVSKLFKEFILFRSFKYNNPFDLMNLKRLLFKFTHHVYGAFDTYMQMSSLTTTQESAPSIIKADYLLSFAVNIMKDIRLLLSNNVL
ncbi:hypothetical protein SAMN04515624_1525 [Eubacterium maltosivorans]|nr:hypothetical protein EUMA32_28000 [Eubacterium maltosivorans]SDP88388.1 hypothetical protein SAMN04515624_1525 [Eubacterium maltosivorans]